MEYVLSKTFQNLMAGSSCSIFSRKPSALPKDTNFLSAFSKNLDLFTKKASVLLSPKTTVHVIEPEDIEKVFRSEGKYPRRLQLDIWLEYRKRRNYFPDLILL